MFAVFVALKIYTLPLSVVRKWDAITQKVIERVASGIPDKITLLMVRPIPIRVLDSLESLVVWATFGGYL